ncbi:MAG: hypothetical protein FWC27_06075 [Firmicutes bacterium]|nr:hypothetical protein [Bacillota bacterium]
MKRAKMFFALLLCAALSVGLATPAFAETSDFTVVADKRMVATGETITLTAVNAPQAQAGQTVQYRWFFSYSLDPESAVEYAVLLGATTDTVIQAQVPGRDSVKTLAGDPGSLYSQQFSTRYWCVADISGSAGIVASYRSSKIKGQGYYSLKDSFALPYEHLAEAIVYMLIPGLVFAEPSVFFDSIACLFGIVWSPFVGLANAAEAKRVNG